MWRLGCVGQHFTKDGLSIELKENILNVRALDFEMGPRLYERGTLTSKPPGKVVAKQETLGSYRSFWRRVSRKQGICRSVFNP